MNGLNRENLSLSILHTLGLQTKMMKMKIGIQNDVEYVGG